MRGLPTLVALPPRARRSPTRSRAITDRYRRRTLRHAAARLRVLGRARARGHAVGRAGRRHRRAAAGSGRPRPAHRAGRAAARPGGLLAAAPGRRRVPRRRRGRGDLRGRLPSCTDADVDAEQTWRTRRPVAGPITVDGLVVVRPGRTVRGPGRAVARDPVPAASPWSPGPSGCGKSTLLDALAGLLAPVRGLGRRRWAAPSAGRPGAPRWPGCPSARSSSPARIADNLRLAAPTPPTTPLWAALRRVALEERVRRPPGRPRHARSARTAPPCPPASGRGSRWPGSSWPTGPGCCSTSRRAHLDELTEQVIADTLVELGRPARSSSWPTGPRWSPLADHRSSLHGARGRHGRAPRSGRRRPGSRPTATAGTEPATRPPPRLRPEHAARRALASASRASRSPPPRAG